MAGVTAEQVQAAAEAIASEGQRPNVRNVRDRLGTGSFNTIQRYLSEWRETRPKVAQAAYELPAELANAFGKELRRGAEAATAEIRAELAEAHQESKDLAEVGEALEQQVEELEQQIEALTHERDTAAAEAAARADEIQRLSDQVRREQDAAEAARTEVATTRVKIETQAEQLDDLKRQWSEQVASLKGEIADYHQKLDVARDGAQQAQQNAAVAEARAQAQIEKADDLKEIVSGLRTELAEARAETKAAREQAAKDAEAWREQIALEHKRNAELQSERESLADKVTTLEQQEKELMSKLKELEKEQSDD